MRGEPRLVLFLALLLVAGCSPMPPTIVERVALKGHAREVVSIAVAPDGKTLASRGADAIKVWDLARGVETASLPEDGSNFGSVAFSPDSKKVAFNRAGTGVEVWDRESKDRRLYKGNHDIPVGGFSCYSVSYGWGVAYAPDGKTIVGGGSHGGENGTLTLWDVGSDVNAEIIAARGPIIAVAYSPDGRSIASAGISGRLVLWDAATRRERLRIEAKRSYLAPIAFSADGRLIASADESRWVRLWDASTGAEVGSLKGHLKAVLSLAFSPDGKALVSGDSGGTLFVWDPVARRMLTRLESDRGKIWALGFTPDGRTLISSGEDRLIHLWDVTWPGSTGEAAR